MKKTLYTFSGIILSLFLCFSAKANHSGKSCFTDGFGYVWKISYVGDEWGNYTVSGTVDIGSGTLWSVVGYSTIKDLTGPVEFTAINPAPDGCYSYTDSFAYHGSAYINHQGGFSTSGAGSWDSYCGGSILSKGTWYGYGPCQDFAKNVSSTGPARHSIGTSFSMKLAPNPMKSSSTVTYNLTKESQVKITVYNYMQQPVKEVVNRTESSGIHSYTIDGSSLTNGVYRVVAVVDGKIYTTSLQVVR